MTLSVSYSVALASDCLLRIRVLPFTAKNEFKKTFSLFFSQKNYGIFIIISTLNIQKTFGSVG